MKHSYSPAAQLDVHAGVVFLRTDMRLSSEERSAVVLVAINMFYEHLRKTKITTATYEGIVKDTGRYYTLGIFGGRHFCAELETDHGHSRLEMLVAEPTDPSLN